MKRTKRISYIKVKNVFRFFQSDPSGLVVDFQVAAVTHEMGTAGLVPVYFTAISTGTEHQNTDTAILVWFSLCPRLKTHPLIGWYKECDAGSVQSRGSFSCVWYHLLEKMVQT